MPDFICIIREDKLNELFVVFENVDSDNGLVVFFIWAEDTVKILPFFVFEEFETDTDELKESQ